jgi:hypothetical protein
MFSVSSWKHGNSKHEENYSYYSDKSYYHLMHAKIGNVKLFHCYSTKKAHNLEE